MSFTYPLWHQVTWSLAQIMWRQKDKVVGSWQLSYKRANSSMSKKFPSTFDLWFTLTAPYVWFFFPYCQDDFFNSDSFHWIYYWSGVKNVSSRKKPLTITTNIFKNGQKFVRLLSKKFAIYKNYQKNFKQIFLSNLGLTGSIVPFYKWIELSIT